ncbi:MAG: tRNA lysidine(34) synthetase TilS, partial [Casimicrobiaceae bacterium]
MTIAAWVRDRPHGERITVGCSGGLDSSVLLHALAAERAAQRPDLDLRAHHVHHGLFPEADTWLGHVGDFCARLGVPFSAERVSVDTGSGRGLEAAARQARYASFARLATDCLVLAHHAEDQAETVLLQLLRGGGPRALAGMPMQRQLGTITLARPLLALPRAAIARYAENHAIVAVDDPSNADTHLARARLRVALWPALRDAFPDALEQIASAARQHAEAARLMDALAEHDLATCHSTGKLLLEPWQALAPERRRNVLRRWLIDQGAASPSWRGLAELAAQLEHVKTGLRVPLRPAEQEKKIELRAFRG